MNFGVVNLPLKFWFQPHPHMKQKLSQRGEKNSKGFWSSLKDNQLWQCFALYSLQKKFFFFWWQLFLIKEYFISFCNHTRIDETIHLITASYPFTEKRNKLNISRPTWLLISEQGQFNRWTGILFPKLSKIQITFRDMYVYIKRPRIVVCFELYKKTNNSTNSFSIVCNHWIKLYSQYTSLVVTFW